MDKIEQIREYTQRELKILYQAYEDHTKNNAAQTQSIVKFKIGYFEDILKILDE